MSTLCVKVSKIEKVTAHPNADALDLCIVEGYQCVTAKGLRKEGDIVVYVPPDSVMPLELSDKIGVTKYLSNGRVKCAKLRGEPSFGVIMEPADPSWQIGQDVQDYYGITKYIPPVKVSSGDADVPNPLLPKYTSIENLRHFANAFETGELVVLTEKIHGTNCKIGLIEGEEMAASMDLRRKRPPEDQMANNIYWSPFTIPAVKKLLYTLAGHVDQSNEQFVSEPTIKHNVVIYGEVYGSKIQNLSYGMEKGNLGFAVFDIMIGGTYLDYDKLSDVCKTHNVSVVPEIARGPYTLEFVREHSKGNTTFNGVSHIREGVVVRPLKEKSHPKLGRLILKYISDEYLLMKSGGKVTDSTDV
jgi:RNA ligase (TIGR02306 family)